MAKMQHYVPRHYLRNFSINPEEETPQVYCFSKPDERMFQTGITNIAGEKYFYDLPGNQPFENTLADIEGEYSDAYDKLINNPSLETLNENDKSAIAYSIAIQELRTRVSRDMHAETIEKLVQKIKNQNLTEEFEEEVREVEEEMQSEDLARNMQIDIIDEHGWEFARYILEMKWIIFKNESDRVFWTSDHPITRYNRYDFGPMGSLGLLNRGIEIYFPLSPKICLAFIDPEEFAQTPNKIVLSNSEKDQDHITLVNELQVKYSKRHIFSNQSEFKLAKEILEEQPIYADPERDRTKVE